MKKQILSEEFRRMQLLAGIINESQLDEGETWIDGIWGTGNYKELIHKIENIFQEGGNGASFKCFGKDFTITKTKGGRFLITSSTDFGYEALDINGAFIAAKEFAGTTNESQLKEETVVKEGLQVTTNDQLKKAVEDNKGSAAICKINSEESPAPELKKLNGQFGIIENSSGYNGNFWAESVRMCQPEGADSFFITSNVNKLPAVKGVDGANGCDFSYFELVAVVGNSSNPRKIKSQGGGYEDNPNFDANAKDVRQIVKKY